MLRPFLLLTVLPFLFSIAPAIADEEPDVQRRQPAIAVWRYSLDPSANRRDTTVTYDRDEGLIIDRSPGAGELGLGVANAVSATLSKTNRFKTLDNSAIEIAGRDSRDRDDIGLITPAAAIEAGRKLNLDYIIYGSVESASTDVSRTETEYKRKGKWEREYSYTVRVEATIHHVAVDVRTGEVWKELRDRQTRSESQSWRPGRSQWRSLFSKVAEKSAANFVHKLVPDRQGKVIARGNGVLVINLGRNHGVGLDTDFNFTRQEPLRDETGAAIRGEDGEFLIRRISITTSPSDNHKPGPIFGRPVEVQDEFCTVKVGYRGSGGFLGLDTKFRENNNCFSAIQVGDEAVLLPRVGK